MGSVPAGVTEVGGVPVPTDAPLHPIAVAPVGLATPEPSTYTPSR